MPDACVGKILFQNVDLMSETEVQDLAGFDCILGNLKVDHDSALTSLVGLEHIIYVDDWLDLFGADELVDLGGLEGLLVVGRLSFNGNAELADISAISGLRRVKGEAHVVNNAKLDGSAVEALFADVEVGGELEICGNLGQPPC